MPVQQTAFSAIFDPIHKPNKNSFFTAFLFILLSWQTMADDTDLDKLRRLKMEDPQKAVQLGEELWRQDGHPNHEAIGILLLQSYNLAKQYEKVISFTDSLMKQEDLSGDLQYGILLQRLVAMGYLKKKDDYESILSRVRSFCNSNKDDVKKAKLWMQMGVYNYKIFNLPEAEKSFKLAIQQHGDSVSETVAREYENLGAIQAQRGELDDALASFLKVEQIHKALKLEPSYALYKNLGGLYLYLKEWEESIEYSQRAIALLKKDDPQISGLYSNIGAAQVESEKYDEAYLSFKKAIEIGEEHNSPNPNALQNLAYLEQRRGNFKAALNLFTQAAAIYVQKNEDSSLAIVDKNLGETWVKLRDRKKAASYFQEAYDLYAQTDYKPKKIELYPMMIENLEALGKHVQALKLMHEYKELNDQITNADAQERIAKLQSSFDLERKELELARAKQEQLVQKKEIDSLQKEKEWQGKQRRGLLVLVLALSGIALLLFRMFRIRGKANLILSAKNQQIEIQHQTLHDLNKKLLKHSLEDVMTGLKNRRFVREFIQKEAPYFERLIKEGNRPNILLIISDLDHFKRINDVFGHTAGDQVIMAFANILRSCSRESDIVARWGGEEFLWICRDAKANDGHKFCERVLEELAKNPIKVGTETLYPTCSLGFAPFPITNQPEKDWERCLKYADAALYEAKRAGRNGWVGYDILEPTPEDDINEDPQKDDIQPAKIKRLHSERFNLMP